MQIAKKIRLYPNKEQEELFWQFAGTSRWAWNESLAYRMARYDKDKSNTTVQQEIEHIQDLKHNNSDYDWVNSIPEAITKQAIKDLDKAYKSFFKSGFGKPKFKKKGKCNISFYQRTDNFRQVDDTHIKIIGIKSYVKVKKCVIPGRISNTRVSFDGKYWYLSYTYEVKEQTNNDGSLICLPVSENTPVHFIEPCNSDPNSFYIRKGKAKDCKLSDLNKTAFLNEDKAMDAVLTLMTLSK